MDVVIVTSDPDVVRPARVADALIAEGFFVASVTVTYREGDGPSQTWRFNDQPEERDGT